MPTSTCRPSCIGSERPAVDTVCTRAVPARNPRFWSLVRAFGERTGVPVLLNTSFNNHHEPIVESVDDAVVCFLTTGLTGLVVGDHLVRKPEAPAAAYRSLRVELPADHLLVHGRERAPGGAAGGAFTAVQTPAGKLVPVSAALARILAGGAEGRSVGEALAAGGDGERADLADVVAELRELWERRQVLVTPVTV